MVEKKLKNVENADLDDLFGAAKESLTLFDSMDELPPPPLEDNAVYFDEVLIGEDDAIERESIETVESESLNNEQDLSDTELAAFEAAAIEDVEFVEDERLESILESILFATDRATSLASIKQIFQGTNISTKMIKKSLDHLMVEYAGGRRGVTLEEVPGGYQLRTKLDNLEFLKRSVKTRPFKVSGPAMEVLSIVAYKQPVVKYEVDEIRGVESGHLLRALMEKNLVAFAGKSDLPGKPMLYQTTKKFLEIFSLRNLNELPTLSQIDELLPEGINEDEAEKPKLADVTDAMAHQIGENYSENEGELLKITDQLQSISTSSEFFENEKNRQKEKKDADKAQNIREALVVGEEVSTRDVNWLKRYEEALITAANTAATATTAVEAPPILHDESEELERAFEMLESGEFENVDSESEYGIDGDPNDIADIEQ
jgi:segregation and condensation protein B